MRLLPLLKRMPWMTYALLAVLPVIGNAEEASQENTSNLSFGLKMAEIQMDFEGNSEQPSEGIAGKPYARARSSLNVCSEFTQKTLKINHFEPKTQVSTRMKLTRRHLSCPPQNKNKQIAEREERKQTTQAEIVEDELLEDENLSEVDDAEMP